MAIFDMFKKQEEPEVQEVKAITEAEALARHPSQGIGIIKDSIIRKPEEVPDAEIGNMTAVAEPRAVQGEEGYDPKDLEDLYLQNSWVRKYINIIVRACLQYKLQAVVLPLYKGSDAAQKHVEEINQLLRYPNLQESFLSVRKKILVDLLLHGNGAMEFSPKKGPVKELYAAPGFMLRVNTDNKGNFVDPEMAYIFLPPGYNQITDEMKTPEKMFPFNSIVHYKYDELSDRIYGISPLNSVTSELEADAHSVKDMARGDYGVPPTILSFPKQSKTFVDKVVSMIHQTLTGKAGNKVIAVNVDCQKYALSDKKYGDEFAYQKWLATRHNVYGIPTFKLGFTDGSGSTSATREQRDEFMALVETLVQYECELLTVILARNRMKYLDVEIICPALVTRLDFDKSRVIDRLVSNGIITPNEAREVYLGLAKSPDPEADKLQLPNNKVISTTPTPVAPEDQPEPGRIPPTPDGVN